MKQKVYLTRHGQTLDNAVLELVGGPFATMLDKFFNMGELEQFITATKNIDGSFLERLAEITGEEYTPKQRVPKTDRLTQTGVLQAETLGKYLKTQVRNSQKVFFLTSGAERTQMTAKIAAEKMGLNWVGGTYEACPHLGESMIYLPESDDPIKIEESERMFALGIEQVGSGTRDRLISVCRQHPDKDIVAVLHGNRNFYLLKYLFSNLIRAHAQMDNCALHTLYQNGGKLKAVGKLLTVPTESQTISICLDNYLLISQMQRKLGEE